MLKIICEDSVKQEVKRDIIKEFGAIDDFNNLDLDEENLLSEMPYGLAVGEGEYGDDWLFYCPSEEEGAEAIRDFLGKIKKIYPQIEVKGSFLLGDDNHRTNYWFESEADSIEVKQDYSAKTNEFSDNPDIPISSCWFSYAFESDYGIEHTIIVKAEDLISSVEEFLEADPAEENEWDEYSEDFSEFLDSDYSEWSFGLPYDENDRNDVLNQIADKFADELDDYEGELQKDVLEVLMKYCSDNKRAFYMAKMEEF